MNKRNLKKINLVDIIEKEILKNEKAYTGSDGWKGLPEFEKKDFIYLFEYIKSYKTETDAIHFISFCLKKVWSDINSLTFGETLWGYDFDNLNFIGLIIEKLDSIVDSYFLLITAGHIDQAQTVFRNYIELVSILFACKMDKEFFLNYIANFNNEQEYTKHWYRDLKPEKVKKLLQNLHDDSDILISQKFQDYTIDRFTGNQREILYSYSSSIAHSKFDLLKSKDLRESTNNLNISTDYLANSTSLIKTIFRKELRFENSKTERLHQIIFSIWNEILYNNILINS